MRSVSALLSGLALVTCPALAQEFTTLKGHGGPVMGLAVSDSGEVASASFDNSVGRWQNRTPQWLEGHAAAVIDLIFLPDGRIASGADDFSIWLWDGTDGRELGRHKGKVTDLAVSRDGAALASASWDGTIGIWPLAEPDAPPASLDLRDTGANDVAFSPDSGLLYAATSKGDIRVYDLSAPEGDPFRTLVRHGFAINEMVLSPDGSWMAYGAVDGVTRVIDTQTGTVLRDFTLERRPILAMAFHGETGKLAVSDGHGYISVISTESWRIERDFHATRRGPVWALAFSPDGSVIWAGGLDSVVYGWPIELLDRFEPSMGTSHSFLKDPGSMSNGERQFMRKCSICHALDAGNSRKAGPNLNGVFGRLAGTVPGYRYSDTLDGSDIVWNEESIDALFDLGPDNYIPGSKMPMQQIAAPEDRRDLIDFLRVATGNGN